VPVFICFAVKQKSLLSLLAAGGAGFMFITYWLGSLRHAAVYAGLFAVLAIIGAFCYIHPKMKHTRI
jgi:hypothetical protein